MRTKLPLVFTALLLLVLFLGNNKNTTAQIYAPEGLNMPGAWNGWTNPPTNNLALASYTQVSGGRVTKILPAIPGGQTRWQTIISAAASGGDVTGGTHQWVFTSGSTGTPWSNKWAAVTVSLNTLQNYTYSGAAANSSITLTNGKWYSMNWKDSGYTGTQAIFMETSAQPVDLASLSVPSSVAANQAATITLTTSNTPAAEELFYLLYSTNNWVTSAITSFTMTGSSGTATIPGQSPGAVVKYYAFSSTVSSITNNYDLYTIKLNSNGGNYFSYTVSGLSTQAEILGFTMAEQVAPAVINPLTATVTLEVLPNTPLTALIPTITVSAGASINPASGVARDFTSPVTYTVTAEDGTTTKVWTVTVTNAVPNYGLQNNDGVNLPTMTYWYTGQGADITQKGSEFTGQNLGALSSLIIKGSSFKTYKTGTGDVTGAQFKYKVWSTTGTEPVDYTLRNVNWTSNDGDGNQTWAGFGAQIAITDGLVAGNYNLKIFFTITGTGIAGQTEDGPFTATFEVQELSTEAEILTFELAEQTGPATINSGAATVNIEVAYGTVLTALTPTITVSANATISPDSGITLDFTGPVTYTVTSESLSEKVWTVTVTVAPPPSINWANLQWPQSGSIVVNGSYNVYGQVYANGITNGAGQGAGIQAWIGYSTDNTNPDSWTNWIPASFQGDAGNNDEYFADLGAAISTAGTYYYATRFQLDAQAFVYGGFQGGFWDGINNVSGQLTISGPSIAFANLQWPADGTITPNQEFNVYAQVYADGYTNQPGQGTDIQAWIGYSTDNTNPDSWTNWIAATYLSDAGNNDEYFANLGAVTGTPGTYYYASRFQLGTGAFVYGGFSGGFWDGITNISGVLTVNAGDKTLNLNVLLEGLYDGNGLMRQANGETGPQYGPGIADHITVQLHNDADYGIIEQSYPDVELGTDGIATVTVSSLLSGSYYLSIVHRNSIETTSALPVSFAAQSITYNFDNPASAFGNNLVQMIDGWYAIFGGDVNQDGFVDTGDVTPLDNDQFNFTMGYVPTDVNGDGSVDTGDITIVDNNQFNFVGAALP
ncbi:MAG: hypothetical protein FD166_990 [Bacteroidetes bacterium]|nr:MAG: hypothetical protein FD166_990 [Bacteroidota bacterium]